MSDEDIERWLGNILFGVAFIILIGYAAAKLMGY